MKGFYSSMHALANVTFIERDRVLCRLINNVSHFSPCISHYFVASINNMKIVSALNFLTTQRIGHRLIKPQNMLVNKQGTFKVCDFGILHCNSYNEAMSRIGAIPHAYTPVLNLIFFLFSKLTSALFF
jgi:serine/threonine protein kinase